MDNVELSLLKEIADIVTPFDNNNDGLVSIIEEFFGC